MASTNTSSSSSSRTARASIHTPLKPASVQDLKAKFDPSKSSGGGTSTSPDRKDVERLSFGKGSTSVGGNKSSSGVSLSSVSSALQSAAQRRIEANSSSSISSSSTSSSSFSSSTSSSTTKTTSKSSLAALTTPRPFTPSSTVSKTSSLPPSSTSRTGPQLVNLRATTAAKTASLPHGSSNKEDIRSSFEKDSEGRIELPVMHITGSGNNVKVTSKTSPRGTNVVDNRFKQNDDKSKVDSRSVSGSKFNSNTKSPVAGNGGSPRGSPKASPRGIKTTTEKAESPPVQRTNRLIAREITIERLDSGVCVTSYKDQPNPASKADTSTVTTTSKTTSSGSGNKVREIKVHNVPSTTDSSSSPNQSRDELPFRQVKLRNTKEQIQKQNSKDKLVPKSTSELKPKDLESKRISRKMSSERFERLKFDFERGVPTECGPLTDSSENSDHVALQKKAREFSVKEDDDEVPIIVKAKKEESIFTEGLKVSDFVKQVNKMNPEMEPRPKWKVQKRNSQTSSAASSDVGGEISGDGGGGGGGPDCYYEGIPGEELDPTVSDDEAGDDIYEQVTLTRQEPSVADSDQDGIDSSKAPGRRLGVYSNLKKFALKKLKQKGGKKRQQGVATVNQSNKTADDSDQEVVVHSDGENGWEEEGGGSSSGTDYEDVGQDYEVGGETYEDLEAFTKQAEIGGGNVKNKTLTHKLKKIFVNSKGQKEKKKKKKAAAATTDTVVAAAATDSEGEIIEDTDEGELEGIETLSRTSSERSSGRFVRNNSQGQAQNDISEASAMSSNTAVIITESSSDDTVSPPVSGPSSQLPSQGPAPPPPPLPPRSSRNLSQLAENSPPLPPRNPALSGKATLGVSLDTVVPISPPAKRNSHYATDKKKDRFSFNSQDGSDSGCSIGKLEYIDYDPASAQTLERGGGGEKGAADRKSTASSSSRPSSSAASSVYMYPDISAFPEGEDSLYVDLEDEQIYGKASDIYVSRFESEPLYQWYSKDKVIQNIRSNKAHSSGDLSDEEYLELERDGNNSDANSVYEDVERLLEKNSTSVSSAKPPGSGSSSSNISNSSQEELRKESSDRPQRRSIIEDVFKNGGTLHRALWCQMPEVIKSGLLQKLTDQEKKIQEAMFEIMTSEASYLKSLKILLNVFVSAPEFASDHSDRCVITRRDRTILFSNIGSIKDISSNFLSDLEARWQESILQKDVCDIIIKHATKNFEPYVRYCRNQAFQERALNTLKQNPEFSEAVKRLEQNSDCQFLPLASFLLLPMQRITRLPLLVDAICHRLEPATLQHASAKKAFEALTKVAKHCDEAAKKIQQAEQMYHLSNNLEFKIKEFPIVSASRFLVKQGELTLIKGEGTVRKPLSKLLGHNKEHVYFFLFNDLLLLTKKKGHTYSVRDYCQRNSLHVEAIDNPEKSRHIAPGMATGVNNLLFLAMLANHDNKQVELVLACKLESERSRWIDAIMPAQANSDTERIYDVWDCPQLQCVRKYLATQPDELTLEESDVVNVTKKLADGWCNGERIRDGEKGWFPASYTEEINNSHVRARNLRLRYRLMMASEEYSQMELTKDKR